MGKHFARHEDGRVFLVELGENKGEPVLAVSGSLTHDQALGLDDFLVGRYMFVPDDIEISTDPDLVTAMEVAFDDGIMHVVGRGDLLRDEDELMWAPDQVKNAP